MGCPVLPKGLPLATATDIAKMGGFAAAKAQRDVFPTPVGMNRQLIIPLVKNQ